MTDVKDRSLEKKKRTVTIPLFREPAGTTSVSAVTSDNVNYASWKMRLRGTSLILGSFEIEVDA